MGCLDLSIVIFSTCIVHIWAQCSISTSRDMGANSPLLIRPDGSFIYPDRRVPDVINFRANENLTGYCPQSMIRVAGARTGIYAVLPFKCISGTKFSAAGKTSEFKDITCTTPVPFVTRQTGNCPNGRLVEIGFQLTKTMFARTIDLCHNSNKGRTYWAHSIISGSITGRQTNRGQPGFRVGDFFKNISVVSAYNRESQRTKLLAIMGNNQRLVDTYIPKTGTHLFSKGHLVANTDLYYTAQQLSSYYYINVLPMWLSINNGNWKLIEENVRNFARNMGDIDIYVGSVYDLALPYPGDQDRLVYLASHNSRSTPVLVAPKVFFKIAHNKAANTAMVFLTANNPYLKSIKLPPDYQICKEYMPCRNNIRGFKDIDKGLSYCCLYSDFMADGYVKAIGLPPLGNPRPLF